MKTLHEILHVLELTDPELIARRLHESRPQSPFEAMAWEYGLDEITEFLEQCTSEEAKGLAVAAAIALRNGLERANTLRELEKQLRKRTHDA